MFWSLVGWGWLLATVPATTQRLEQLYSRASQAYQQQRWEQASQAFRAIIPLMQSLQARYKAGSKARTLMLLGECDVLYHLGDIAWKQQRKRASCRHYQRLAKMSHALPSGWTTWPVHPELPGRIRMALAHFQTECPKIPPLLMLKTLPLDAKVFLKDAKGRWSAISKRNISMPLGTTWIRIEAPGFRPHLHKYSPTEQTRWNLQTLRIELQPLPKVVRVRPPPLRPRRSLPPPTPFYRTWWFWTLAGVVVAGSAAGIIAVAVAPRRISFRDPNKSNGGFSVW